MNKSKFKIFIGSILSLNCFFMIEKVNAAMRRPPSPSKSSQPSTSKAGLGTNTGAIPKYRSPHRIYVSSLRKAQNLSEEEVKPVIESAKKLANDGDFSMFDILERNLRFIGKGNEDIKSAFKVLNEKHYKKSFEDVRYKDKRFQNLGTVYTFEKNDSNDDRKVYLKFSIDKDNKNLMIRGFNDTSIEVDGVDSSKDISKLLNNPELMKIDLDGRIVDKAISILESKIDSGDYRILDRARYGIEQLGLTHRDFRDIMKSLEKKNYISGPSDVKSDKDNKGHIKQGDVFVFGFDDPKTKKEIYIKFIIDQKTNNISVLSFHESDGRLKYFFKDLK